MPEISFEEMKEEYLGAVLDIYNYYIMNTTVTFHLQPLNKDEMREIVFFEDKKYKAYMIKSDGMLCGYAVLGKHAERPAYDITAEVAVYLRHDFTGKGTGRLAVQYIEDIARQNKGIHSLIATICSENKESIRLFEKSGYVQCAQFREIGRKFGRYLDVVSYQKILN